MNRRIFALLLLAPTLTSLSACGVVRRQERREDRREDRREERSEFAPKLTQGPAPQPTAA